MSAEIFAVVFEECTTIPGDERSRTNPGHGYPEHTITSKVFLEFRSQQEFEDWVRENNASGYYRKKFTAYRCTPFTVKTELRVEIG